MVVVLTLTAAAVAGAGATAAWLADRRRSRTRNGRGECASCGTAWRETPVGEPYLIHGRLVCEACAEKTKKRVPVQLGVVGGATALAAGATAASQGLVAMAAFPVVTAGVMTVGAVQLMKVANRHAQRRIAEGEFPDFDAVHGVGPYPAERVLTEASTTGPGSN